MWTIKDGGDTQTLLVVKKIIQPQAWTQALALTPNEPPGGISTTFFFHPQNGIFILRYKVMQVYGRPLNTAMLGSTYTKHQSQCCDNSVMLLAILL